jgi:hypothetical protein
MTTAAPNLGSKFKCFKCECRFYDLGAPEPLCPRCGADQREDPNPEPRAALLGRTRRPPAKSRPKPKPKPEVPAEPTLEADDDLLDDDFADEAEKAEGAEKAEKAEGAEKAEQAEGAEKAEKA